MIEYERKCLISESKYNEILNTMKYKYRSETVLQTNYYYDTSDFLLLQKNETLRVRKKNEKLTVQYKHSKRQDGSTRVCKELAYSILEIPETLHLSNKQCVLLGSLETLRTNFYIEDFKISLDANKYFNITDFEIEIESTKATEEIPSSLQLFSIDFSLPVKSKYKRFIETYKTIKETTS